MRLFSFHLCNSDGLHLPNQTCIPWILVTLVHPQFIPLVSLCIQLNYVALFPLLFNEIMTIEQESCKASRPRAIPHTTREPNCTKTDSNVFAS